MRKTANLLLSLLLCMSLVAVFASCDSLLGGNQEQTGGTTGGVEDSTANSGDTGKEDEEGSDVGDESETPDDKTETPDNSYVDMDTELAKFSSEGLTFELVEDEEYGTYYAVTGYEPPEDDGVSAVSASSDKHEPGYVLIPDTHEGHPVREVDAGAFKNNKHIKKVYFSNNYRFKKIRKDAFKNCENLEDIRLPNNSHEIEDGAFDGCDSLRVSEYKNGIYLGFNSNKYGVLIGFVDYSVSEFVLHDDVYNISVIEELENLKFNEYKNCYYVGTKNNPYFALWKVKDSDEALCNIHEDTRIIAPYAFESSKITSVTVPDKVHTVGEYAFSYCEELKSVIISKGIEFLCDGAFFRSGVRTVEFEKNCELDKIGEEAFYECEKLIEIIIPDKVTEIGKKAFYGCKKLYSVVIGKSVVNVNDAFSKCQNVTKLTLGESMTHIPVSLQQLLELYNLSSMDFAYGVPNGFLYTTVDTPSKHHVTDDGFLFYEDGDVCHLVAYLGEEINVTLPDSYNGKTYDIFQYAFYERDDIEKIAIPEGVSTIGDYAFYGCTSLSNISFPTTIKKLGDAAFGECHSLVSIVFPEGVTEIEGFSVWHNDRLQAKWTTPYIPSVTLPSTLKSFKGHTGAILELVNNSSLELSGTRFVHTGESKTVTIGNYVFVTDNGINYLVDYFGNDVILNLPESFNGESYVIAKYAFWNVDTTRQIIIPESVSEIEDGAFAECSQVIEVINNSSLNIVVGGEDNGRVAYSAKYVNSGKTSAVMVGDFLFTTIDGTNYLLAYFGSEPYLTLPDSFNGESYEIHKSAFAKNTTIRTLIIPDGVTCIGTSAFHASWLRSVIIGDGVTSIDGHAFYDCKKLTELVIGNGVKQIGAFAFSNCGIYSVNIPDSVEVISEGAFANCKNLMSVTVPNGIVSIEMGKDVPYTNAGFDFSDPLYESRTFAFYGCEMLECNEYGNLYYIGNESNPYLVCFGVKDVSVGTVRIRKDTRFINLDKIAAAAETIEIDDEHPLYISVDGILYSKDGKTLIKFPGARKDEGFTVPSYVEIIADKAFLGCDLSSVVICEGVTYIGEFAFSMSLLEGVVIPESVTNIGSGAFANCLKLNSFNIPKNLEAIPDLFMYGSLALRHSTISTVVIPDGVKSIGRKAFAGCNSLVTVSIPDGVTSIGQGAFAHCENLKMITIPDSVATIGNSVFNVNYTSLVVFCEAASAPEGWDEYWCISDAPIVWDCNNNDVASDGRIYIERDGLIFSLKDGEAMVEEIVEIRDRQVIPSVITYKSVDYAVTELGYNILNVQGLNEVVIPNTIKSYSTRGFPGGITIYYTGTEEEWNAIEGISGRVPESVTIHYNYVPEE